MEGPLGVRKGAWTNEEDVLLRKCIEKYGEGNWHQVPLRAGLNRCRKSCRMRWLNYLRPNIKRGEFALDEVDLIIRLHKLLGNRWVLIAGRLPGRTANDVKNYWNTHLRKKMVSPIKEVKDNKSQKRLMEGNIIKPQPHIFSKSLPWLRGKSTFLYNIHSNENICKPSPTTPSRPDGTQWWESNLLVDIEGDKVSSSFINGLGEEPIADFWTEQTKNVIETFLEEGQSDWEIDLSFDINLSDLFSA